MTIPLVSIIIPIFNEEKYIEDCLNSILANDYPKEFLEVLLIDGMSLDRTRAILEKYVKEYSWFTLYDNPKRIQVSALNDGIQKAKGTIIMRMDAHTVYPPDYIRQCVHLLETKNATNVGGVLVAEGRNYVSKGIALAVTCPFGVGNAMYRMATKEEWVDTIFPGAWRKQTLEELGGFNEDYLINEDYELNYRLRQKGGRIFLSPTIKCHYFVRDSVLALFRQYYHYGYWKVKTIVAHPDSLRWRQLVAPVFVISLIASILLLPIHSIFLTIPLLYTIFNLFYSFHVANQKGSKYFFLLPILFLIIHISWGGGFIRGIAKWGFPKMTLKSLIGSFKPIYSKRIEDKRGK